MKKIFILFLIFLLAGCFNKQNEIVQEEFIEPINDIEVFEYLNSQTKSLLYKANCGENVPTYILEMLGKEIKDIVLTDINGNEININDYKESKVVLEIVGFWCSHCKEQTIYFNQKLINAYPDITFIQYFNEGTVEQIKAFYKELLLPLPENIIIVPENKEFTNFILNNFNPNCYPSFFFFNNNILTFVRESLVSLGYMKLIYNAAYVNTVNQDDLVDENGKSIFEYKRSKDDLINDLKENNYKLIELLDNDGVTVKNTLEFMGKKFEFYKQYENDSAFNSEVDFLDYLNSDLVIVYYFYTNEESIDMINEFYNTNKDIDVIVLNVSDENNEDLAMKFEPKLVSIMNQVPKQLNDVVFEESPSALYIQNGYITGCYSNIKDIESFNSSVDIFLRDTSIALLKNN